MRSVIAALALGLISCGGAAASSFEMIGEGQATAPEIGNAGSSIVLLGEPAEAKAGPVDSTETASVDTRADAAPRARTTAAMAAADWARVSSTKSPSMLYFGEPDPNDYKLPEPEVASYDPTAVPMVMRGGIEGDLFVTPEADEATTDAAAAADKPASDTAETDPAASQTGASKADEKQAAASKQPDVRQPVPKKAAKPAAAVPQ